MTRAVFFLAALCLAVPAGSIQGAPESLGFALPAAPAPDLSAVPLEYRAIILDAASSAGIPAWVLAGVAYAESSYRPAPRHADPADRGMFGLREAPGYHDERVRLYGEYDPCEPGQAARVAAGILADHRDSFGGWPSALSAYRRGRDGVARDGVDWGYVWTVYEATR